MKIGGKAWKFGNHIDTDLIIPARFLNTSDKNELAKGCFADLRPDFFAHAQEGDIIIAGTNFGCGSSREHAPVAIKACGISLVIAKGFARIFYRNAFNIGLPLLECQEAVDDIEEGDRLRIDLISGEIINQSKGTRYSATPIPEFMMNIIKAGGLVNYIKSKSMKGGVHH